jgi:hypothetical protein
MSEIQIGIICFGSMGSGIAPTGEWRESALSPIGGLIIEL